jgi:hypothetical protein
MPRDLNLVITLAHPPFSPYHLPCAWTKKKRGGKKRREQKRKKGNRKKYQGPEGAALPFSLSHG